MEKPHRSITYFAICAVALVTTPATAQVVQGIVLAGDPPGALGGVDVQLSDADRGGLWDTKTGHDGRFTQSVGEGGRYAIWVRGVGYRPSLTVVQLGAADTVEVKIQLQTLVVALSGVTVYGLSVRTPGQEEFWSRRDKPWVQSIDYEQLEELRPGNLQHLVHRALPFKLRCGTPLIYIDGLQQDFQRQLDDTPIAWVYGVEVFKNYYDIPTRYRDSTDPRSRCGAVFIWKTVPGQLEER